MSDSSRMSLPLTKRVVVIGAGTMGCGIAEVAALAGHRVYLIDVDPRALERGMAQLRRSLDRRVERGRLDPSERVAALDRITPASEDTALECVGLVIEVIAEDLNAKVALLGDLEERLDSDAILATNTSSLSITALGGRLRRPERLIGMHFFNPATTLRLIEVVNGQATAPDVTQTIVETARAWGKHPVVCKSTPGFIVNRIARPFYGEALRLLQEQAATPATLDAVMRGSGGFRMGPCELMDLIGHDVNFAVTRSVYEAFFEDPRYKPSLVQKNLVDAGWLGRKSGRGFFDYRDGASPPVPDEAPDLNEPPRIVRVEGDLGPAGALVDLLRQQPKIVLELGAGSGLLRVDGTVLVLCDGRTATERSIELQEPVILFDLALDYVECSRIALAAAAQAEEAQIRRAIALFRLLGKQVSMMADVPGMAVTRTVAMLVNEACDGVYQGIASAEDIDAAMQMGVNYPEGPMAWGRRIGLPNVLRTLRNLGAAYGEDRYRASMWLQRAVQAMAPLHCLP